MAYENDVYSDGGEDTNLGVDLLKSAAKFTISMSALEMAGRGYYKGFHLPGTAGGFRKKAGEYVSTFSPSRFGRRRGLWGKGGLQFAKPIGPELAGIYEKGGVLGFRGAQRAAAAAFGERVAAGAGAKYLISRASGLVAKLAGYPQLAYFGATFALQGYKAVSSMVMQYRSLELGGYFPETRGSYTSRQRALQAITSSNLQAKSAIGNEAMLLHH